MTGLNALVNVGPFGAIATTLPLAILVAGSTLVGSSWADEIPAAEPSPPVEEVGLAGEAVSEDEPAIPSPPAEAAAPAEIISNGNASDLCPNQPCPDLSTAASDLIPLPAAVNPEEPSAPTLAQTPPAETAPAAVSTGDLTAAAQNPIANLISVPFQNNTNFGVGPDNRTQNILNIQPVVPVPLSEDLLLVTRTILPIVAQPIDGNGTIWGLGDLNPSFFFVPVTASNITWGVGPTLVLPTATDRQTGAGKWSAGPAGAVIVTSGQWIYGGLASQIWSFAGDGNRPAVSQFVLQPLLNYNLPRGWYLTSSPVITANWNAPGGDQWTVPIGGGFGRVFAVGSQPLNTSLQLYWNAVRPTNGADFSLRAQVQLLFPR